MRCLTLAKALRGAGGRCSFITRAFQGHLGDWIATEGFEVILLPDAHGPFPKGPPEHAGWAKVTWERDAEESRSAIDQSPDWLVIDHYAFDSRWEVATRPSGTNIMVLDDLADRPHECELLLDQSLGRLSSDYNTLLPDRCVRLTGPKFALLRPEFAALRTQRLPKARSGRMRRVLLAMGGMDSGNHVRAILEAMNGVPRVSQMEVTITICSAAPGLPELRKACAGMGFATELRVDAKDIAQVMCDADLAITASGITAYELASLGVPMLLLPVSDIQRKVARLLVGIAEAVVLEDWQDDPVRVIGDALNRWPEPLFSPEKSSRSHVIDGLGTQRVVDAMLHCLSKRD